MGYGWWDDSDESYECSAVSSHHDELSDTRKAFINSIKALWESKTLCDFTIITQGHEFPIHKAYVATASKVLMDMFTQDSSRTSYRCDDISPAAMQHLLHYIYTDNLTLKADMVEEVIKAATSLKVDPVLKLCKKYKERRESDDELPSDDNGLPSDEDS